MFDGKGSITEWISSLQSLPGLPWSSTPADLGRGFAVPAAGAVPYVLSAGALGSNVPDATRDVCS